MKASAMRLAILLFGLLVMNACAPLQRTIKSSNYTNLDAIEHLHVVVVGSIDTNASFGYLKHYMKDSLSQYFTLTSAYGCCIGPKVSSAEVFKREGTPPPGTTHVLIIAPQKYIEGIGTSSLIEYRMNLFNLKRKEIEWEYEMALTFSWFVSDKNYRKVALASAKNMMREMRQKEIVRKRL